MPTLKYIRLYVISYFLHSIVAFAVVFVSNASWPAKQFGKKPTTILHSFNRPTETIIYCLQMDTSYCKTPVYSKHSELVPQVCFLHFAHFVFFIPHQCYYWSLELQWFEIDCGFVSKEYI